MEGKDTTLGMGFKSAETVSWEEIFSNVVEMAYTDFSPMEIEARWKSES